MNKNEIYDRITEKLLLKLESGVIPWRRSWKIGLPANYFTHKPYSGVNYLSLCMDEFPSPFYLTYKMCNDLGERIKEGARGNLIIYWNVKEYPIDDERSKRVPLIRYSYVFNIAQTTIATANEPVKIVECEELISRISPAPIIKNNFRKCFYNVLDDYVSLPAINDFESKEEYYSSLFHELAHWTGHSSRLNRISVIEHKSDEYSFEETVAEISSSYLCGMCGIEPKIIDNQASYISHYLKAIKEDKDILIRAAAAAQKAVNFLLSSGEEDEIMCATNDKHQVCAIY